MSIEIIPAIDILHGKCVRLTQGDYESGKIYNEHPLEVARQFEDAGIKKVAPGRSGWRQRRARNKLEIPGGYCGGKPDLLLILEVALEHPKICR